MVRWTYSCPMNIYYVLNNRFPTIKAYGLQVAKTCEGIVQAGHQVTLVVPRRNRHKEIEGIDPLDLYSVNNRFKIVYLPSLDMAWLGIENKASFIFQQFLFAVVAVGYLMGQKGIIYSRDQFLIYIMSWFRKDLFWEIHRLPENIRSRMYKRIFNMTSGIVAISNGLKNGLMKVGISANKILVAHDGIDLSEFTITKTTEECRKITSLPLDKKIIMYVGHLFEWKGVEVLLQSTKNLDPDHLVVIVGGAPEDIKRIQKVDFIKEGVVFCGFQDHRKIPFFLGSADMLVIPNIKDGGISEYYTSPLKLFEYMASKKPIISSDLPSLREVLDESVAYFFEPNNPSQLASQIKFVANNQEDSQKIAEKAYERVQDYSWSKRGIQITRFIESVI